MNELDLLKEKTKFLLRFNPNHDAKGRFAPGHGGGGSSLYQGKSGRNYGTSSSEDALKEIRNGLHNSLEDHMDSNGNLSEERRAIHKQIIDEYLEGKIPVQGNGEFVMMGGGPASGKSSTIKSGQVTLPDEQHTVIVDADKIKEKLPGYEKMSKETDAAASFYHEESSMIAKQLSNVALDENINVVYDGTGDGSDMSVMKKISSAKAKGYSVKGVYVTVDTDEAIKRNQKRYDDGIAKGEKPRKVPDETVEEIHAKVSNISLSTSDQFDSIELWDNNGPEGSKPKLIGTGGAGKKLTAVPGAEYEFDKFVKKGQ